MFCATAACFTFQTICDSVLFGCIRQRFIKINPLDDCPKLTDRCAVAVGTLDNLPPIHRRDFHLCPPPSAAQIFQCDFCSPKDKAYGRGAFTAAITRYRLPSWRQTQEPDSLLLVEKGIKRAA